ncbi:MAG: MBL fold metallo-hydrolase [Clostridiales bacterium]|nr:MAG: MBL fold metallo-hydrolase [Clostridiales bacterium]
MMKITYLGQAGLLFDNGKIKIMTDPYLSNSVVRVNPRNYRRLPVDESFLKIVPDVLVLTHNHLDHTDPDTLVHYICGEKSVTVLAPEAAFEEARKIGNKNQNYVKFNRHTEWTQDGVKFTSVLAAHSDPHPIGVIIDDGEKKYYITGDTLYNTDIFGDIPSDIDVLFMPVNGLGNNMNKTDAARFAKKNKCEKKVVPYHVGMFDDMTAEDLDVDNKVIPTIYRK